MASPKQMGVFLMIIAGILLFGGLIIAMILNPPDSGRRGYPTSGDCIRRGERHFRSLGKDPSGRFESIEIEAECRRSSRAFSE